jgi:hypothetical protein
LSCEVTCGVRSLIYDIEINKTSILKNYRGQNIPITFCLLIWL